METFDFIIEATNVNIRIDTFLAQAIPQYSRSFFQKLIVEREVLVNDQPVKSNYKLLLDDAVVVHIPTAKSLTVIGEDLPLDVIFEDEDIIVINKPQNMVVHPAPGHLSGTIVNALLYRYPNKLSTLNGEMRPGIVHRIDKDTSGILVIAKNDEAHLHLAKQLKNRTMVRVYHTVVLHNMKTEEGTIETFIDRHPTQRKKRTVVTAGGKKAITHYKVLEHLGNYSYVQASLETGRTHQIRVHMAYINHPILGDYIYGPKSSPFQLEGQMLHAYSLGFVHPTTGKYMEFKAPLPTYFEKLLSLLRNMSE